MMSFPIVKYLSRFILRGIALVACSVLVACSEQPNASHYFPLDKGITWVYKVTTSTPDESSARRFVIENLGETPIRGYENEPTYARLTSDGTHYYLLQDDTGTYRVGTKNLIEYSPRVDEQPIRVFLNMADLEVGRSWSLQTQTYAIRGAQAVEGNHSGAFAFNMEFEVAGVGETVSTPIGDFENCIRIEGRGFTSLYADPSTGYQDVNISQTEWYAPGVGLIKLVRDEPLDLTFFKGGTITFELADWYQK
ncbi:MAG: hypothetical protein ACPGPF_02535 [Pontibacterium sp.]